MHRLLGLSLLELLLALAVATALAVAAVPWLGDWLLDAQRTAAVNGLVHDVHYARQAAWQGLRDVALCRSVDGRSCAGSGNWGSGWLVFVNRDGDDPPVVDPDEPILQTAAPVPGLRITSNRRAYVLRPFPLRATNGTWVVCDRRGARAARAVIVSTTGRPRVTRRSAAGRPLACPP
jgi:type IV fimbrial biogenesis protein FimT